MELSSLLEADIQGIQKQIKTAILNHQIGMMKLRNDPENLEIKKQIADAQNAIISLSTSQKFILQKLRNGMVTNGSSKTCDSVPSSKGVIAVNGSTGCTHVGNNNAHNHMGQNINQHVSVVRPRPSAVSVGTETVGLAAVARENQSTKTNGNYVPVAPNVGCDASSLGGKHAQEGPPCTRPHPTPPQPIIPSHQNSDWPVDVPPRSQINLVPRVNASLNRASLSPSSSGGEDLDDDDDEEEEEENPKGYDYDEEDDMEELKYVPEEDEKEEECLPKKENQPPCKVDPQSHPSDDNDVDSKLKFFAALGLVTRETCSEMQSRRGERKRRSTANPQFIYGNWDLSKRKKNGYLLSSSLPLQLRKRGRPRLDGSSELLLPATYLPLPKSVSNIPYSKDMSNICGNDHFNENQHQFGLSRNHQMLGHALGGALKPSQHYYAADSNHTFSTGHHTKKPLEHINGNITTIRKFCIVCKNISGPLVLCEDCDVRYHPFCGKPLDGKRHCPKCETHSSSGGAPTSNAKKEDASMVMVSCKDAAVTTSVPASTVTCSTQVTAATPTLHSIAAERAAKVEEKRRLLKRNQELNAEKAKLEQRVSELSADLAAQAARKRDLLSSEERTRRSIKRVHEFILNIQQGFKRVEGETCLFKTTSSGPCSAATDTSEGLQSS